MKTKSRIKPVHPGDFLREELTERGISMNQVARDIRIPMSRVSLIVNGKRGITADTALRLAVYFGTSPELWLNLQKTYDLAVARMSSADKIEREVIPASRLSAERHIHPL
jgi:antitoxin HigA-1